MGGGARGLIGFVRVVPPWTRVSHYCLPSLSRAKRGALLLRLKEEKMTEVVMVRRGRRTRMMRRRRWKRLPTLNPPLQRVNEFSWQQIIILVVLPQYQYGISTKSSN